VLVLYSEGEGGRDICFAGYGWDGMDRIGRLSYRGLPRPLFSPPLLSCTAHHIGCSFSPLPILAWLLLLLLDVSIKPYFDVL